TASLMVRRFNVCSDGSRLERLKIYSQARIGHVFLDLSTHRNAWWPYDDFNNDGYELSPPVPALEVSQYVPRERDYDVAELVSALPVPLKQMYWTFLNEQSIEALVVHSSETLEKVWGGIVLSNNETYDQPEDEMQKTVGVLLARCPQLKKVLCPRLAIHIRYLMEHPWVCCDNLEDLRCRVVGIPKMSKEEKSILEVVLGRQKEGLEYGELTVDLQRVLEKQSLVDRCRQALEEQLAKCSKLDELCVSKAWASCFVPVLWRSFRLWHRSFRVKRGEIDIWQCFTDTSPSHDKLRESASEAFAKNGQFIRELTVENPGAVRFLASHCSNLTWLNCRFLVTDDSYFQEHKGDISGQLWGMVERSPHLRTLRFGVSSRLSHRSGYTWNIPDDIETTMHQLIYLQNLSTLRHLSVSMSDEDYFEFCERFPRLLEARFHIRSPQSILHPYKDTKGGTVRGDGDNNANGDKSRRGDMTVQRSLTTLVLNIDDPGSYAQMVQCVFRRFPKLKHFLVYDECGAGRIFLDLGTEQRNWRWRDHYAIDCAGFEFAPGGPSLEVNCRVDFSRGDEVAELISAIPIPLKQMLWLYINESVVAALAAHSSETLEVVRGLGITNSGEDAYSQPEEEMEKTVGVLLARCPKLREVRCSRLAIHIRYLMEHPWVCCDNLEILWCRVVGIPMMSEDEKSVLEIVLDRQKDQHEYREMTAEEQLLLEKQDLVDRCRQALEEQLAKCSKLDKRCVRYLLEQ
ncbi:hypothetical protein DFQ26_006043, partial [Actinomortierella ambigua]